MGPMTLPVPPARGPRGQDDVPPSLAGRAVLVVDDEELIRWSLTQRLGELGCEVREAASIGEARARLADPSARPPDVVLLDLKLPDSDGLSLLADVRAAAPGAVVILMTAHRSDAVTARAVAGGVRAFVDKPFDLETIAGQIAACLS